MSATEIAEVTRCELIAACIQARAIEICLETFVDTLLTRTVMYPVISRVFHRPILA